MSGLSVMMPPFFRNRNAWAALPELDYVAPNTLPTIIHIFLYGGPSELAGNLSNIEDINANSQNHYPSSVTDNITTNAFWSTAGGDIMETLLASGDLSIYRTINRLKSDSRAHGTCVAQNLVGNLDETGAGIATTLAAILEKYYYVSTDELVMPFVSFEGDSKVFNLGDLNPSLVLRPMNLDQNFNNPYSRTHYWWLDKDGEDTNDVTLESMARDMSALNAPRHAKVDESFRNRGDLEAFINDHFKASDVEDNLPIDPDAGDPEDPETPRIQYPTNNYFADKLKAAVHLALHNPDTVFISLGSGGLGGWDDHSNALDNYPSRMQDLFEALEVAAKHLKLAATQQGNTAADKVVINVFGDFGRNVNLNDSEGWDHGNNQNLYTLGGSGINGRVLGKLVGRTERIGDGNQSRHFTSPTADSYQCEPFSIASTIFKYFGVQDPELLTGEPAIDELNTDNEFVPPTEEI